jgi:molybdopterin biosynthesis enzyme
MSPMSSILEYDDTGQFEVVVRFPGNPVSCLYSFYGL